MTYSYDPTKINQRGKDQMRFEIGDTYLSDEEPDGLNTEACILSDEEYDAVLKDLQSDSAAWNTAKLRILEAVIHKLSLQVDTKIDVLEYEPSRRIDVWLKMYDELKKKISGSSAVPSADVSSIKKDPYFYTGMKSNVFADPVSYCK